MSSSSLYVRHSLSVSVPLPGNYNEQQIEILWGLKLTQYGGMLFKKKDTKV